MTLYAAAGQGMLGSVGRLDDLGGIYGLQHLPVRGAEDFVELECACTLMACRR